MTDVQDLSVKQFNMEMSCFSCNQVFGLEYNREQVPTPPAAPRPRRWDGVSPRRFIKFKDCKREDAYKYPDFDPDQIMSDRVDFPVNTDIKDDMLICYSFRVVVVVNYPYLFIHCGIMSQWGRRG